MNKVKLIKERVCFAIFALGISLAAMHEIGCNPELSNFAKKIPTQNESLIIIKS